MAKDILKAMEAMRAHEAEMRERSEEAAKRWTLVSSGYTCKFTDEELADLDRRRAEMRERLTCPDDQYEEVCRRHFGPDWKSD